jgi:hypothetical protein
MIGACFLNTFFLLSLEMHCVQSVLTFRFNWHLTSFSGLLSFNGKPFKLVKLPTASIGSFFSPAGLSFLLLKSCIHICRSPGCHFIVGYITFLSISILPILSLTSRFVWKRFVTNSSVILLKNFFCSSGLFCSFD